MNIRNITTEQWSDKNFILNNMEEMKLRWPYTHLMKFVSKELRGDYDVVSKLVCLDAHEFNYADENLRCNKEIILRTLWNDGSHDCLYDFAYEDKNSDGKINDLNFIKDCFEANTQTLKYASDEILNNPVFMLECIKHDSDACDYIGEQLSAIIAEAWKSSSVPKYQRRYQFTEQFLPSYILHEKLQSELRASDKAQELINSSLKNPVAVIKPKAQTMRMKI